MVAEHKQTTSLEVRPVGPESFETIYPLLLGLRAARMGREDWRRMLFTYPWCDQPYRGYALFARAEAVGFMGTIFSTRIVAGRTERFCNVSSWIVREPYRTASIQLLKPLLALREHTILQLTPTPVSYEIFLKLGFQPLENEQLLFPPVPESLRDVAGLTGASFLTSRRSLERELTGAEATIYRTLADNSLARHVLMRRGSRRCYVVATPSHRKGVRFADVHYIGDREFFWQNRLLAHAAFFRAMGAAALAVDSRFADGRHAARATRRPAKRLYRPSRPGITPQMVDGLYSEWMALRA